MDGCLPALRQDLSIRPTAPGRHGERRYLLHDPLRGCFHRVSEDVVRALARWAPLPPDALLARLPGYSAAELEALTAFLARYRLLAAPPGGDPRELAALEAARRRPWHEEVLHRYLFVRIPLFRPQRFLDRLMPWVAPWLTRGTAWGVLALGALGALLAARQWTDFVSTFLHFFTLEGMLFYGLTLAVLKALHELGHAVAARHYGAHVPVIGIAFLVLFPILYTDTTDAYRIPDARKRAAIDAAGMMVEVAVACLALLLWSVLPDGPLRSVAFFAATTGWLMSLAVNLNPCMRFDGYYLLQDLLGLSNLQARGFAFGRWHMRRTLLGVDEGRPDVERPRLTLAYAYATWVYRFFLFIGIALLVHHIFPKAVGIVLFTAEIGMFIVRPVWAELKHWWSLRMSVLSNPRGRASLLVLGALLALGSVPWQGSVRAPALVRPAQAWSAFAPEPAQVAQVHARPGDTVRAGEPVLTLESAELQRELQLARLRLALAEAELDKAAADRTERASTPLRRDKLREAQTAVDALAARAERLVLRAPFDATVLRAHASLDEGLGATPTTELLRLSGSGLEAVALVAERDAARIAPGAAMRFVSDGLGAAPREVRVGTVAATAQSRVDEPLLTLAQGGRIAVVPDARGELVADTPVVRVTARTPEGVRLTERGVVIIEAERRAPLRRVFHRAAGLLLRETDF